MSDRLVQSWNEDMAAEDADCCPHGRDAAACMSGPLLLSRLSLEVADISAELRDVESDIIRHVSEQKAAPDNRPIPPGLQRIDRILQRLNGVSELLASIAPETLTGDRARVDAAIQSMRLAEQVRNLRHGLMPAEAEGAGKVVLF